MKKTALIAILSVCLNIALAVGLVYVCKYDTEGLKGQLMSGWFKSKADKTKLHTQKHYSIACLIPSRPVGIQSILDGFKETLAKFGITDCDYKEYDANGNRTLLRSHIEDILDRQFDMVFSVGAEPTKLLKEISAKKQKLCPVVFAGVKDPVGLGIVETEKSSGNNFTGVSADHNYKLQIALLWLIKKDIKNALIVYDPTQLGGRTAFLKREVEDLLHERNVNVKGIEVYNINEIVSRVSPFISNADVVITLRDNTVIPAMEVLSRLCNENGVTLFASDLGSIEKGAALAFGCYDYDSGVVAAHKARLILEEGKKPTEVPITDVGDRNRLRVNAAVMDKQNLHIDPNIFFLMNHGEVLKT